MSWPETNCVKTRWEMGAWYYAQYWTVVCNGNGRYSQTNSCSSENCENRGYGDGGSSEDSSAFLFISSMSRWRFTAEPPPSISFHDSIPRQFAPLSHFHGSCSVKFQSRSYSRVSYSLLKVALRSASFGKCPGMQTGSEIGIGSELPLAPLFQICIYSSPQKPKLNLYPMRCRSVVDGESAELFRIKGGVPEVHSKRDISLRRKEKQRNKNEKRFQKVWKACTYRYACIPDSWFLSLHRSSNLVQCILIVIPVKSYT